MRIKIKSAKQKGRNLQKWVCEKIANLLGIEYNQQDDQCEIHSREMGQSGTDIILRGGVKEKFPYSIECKSAERFNLLEAIKQSKKNINPGTTWLVVYKRRALKEPVVIMDWSCFEKIIIEGLIKWKVN